MRILPCLALICMLNVCIQKSIGAGFQWNFGQRDELIREFVITTTGESGLYQKGGGVGGAGAAYFPYVKQASTYASSKSRPVVWQNGRTIRLRCAFKLGIADFPRVNRRALSLGVASGHAENKPVTLQEPVHLNVPSIAGGLYVRSQAKATGILQVDFHGTTSLPDNPFSLTNSLIQLDTSVWHELEVTIQPEGKEARLDVALYTLDEKGERVSGVRRHLGGTRALGFAEGQELHVFFGGRDSFLAGVRSVDYFEYEQQEPASKDL